MSPDQLLEALDHFGDAYAAARVEQTDAADAREADARRPIVEAFRRLDVELEQMLAKYDKLWNACAFTEGERDEAREALAAVERERDDALATVQAQEVYRQAHYENTQKVQEQVMKLVAERDELRQHILDIDAHATPYGDIPDDPGYVGTYLLTAGALHRALGKVGHTAPKCQAEAELAEARAELARYAERLDQLSAVVDAAQAWRRWFPHASSMFVPENTLIAAVDAYRLSECVDETADGIEEDLRTEPGATEVPGRVVGSDDSRETGHG